MKVKRENIVYHKISTALKHLHVQFGHKHF